MPPAPFLVRRLAQVARTARGTHPDRGVRGRGARRHRRHGSARQAITFCHHHPGRSAGPTAGTPAMVAVTARGDLVLLSSANGSPVQTLVRGGVVGERDVRVARRPSDLL